MFATVERIAGVRRARVAVVTSGVGQAAVGGDARFQIGGCFGSAVVATGILACVEHILGFVKAIFSTIALVGGHGGAVRQNAGVKMRNGVGGAFRGRAAGGIATETCVVDILRLIETGLLAIAGHGAAARQHAGVITRIGVGGAYRGRAPIGHARVEDILRLVAAGHLAIGGHGPTERRHTSIKVALRVDRTLVFRAARGETVVEPILGLVFTSFLAVG
jgi:hypothetical protein